MPGYIINTLIFCTILVGLMSGCTGFSVAEDPCAHAYRPVTFETLFENSVRNSYEKCLNLMRSAAVQAVED